MEDLNKKIEECKNNYYEKKIKYENKEK